MNKDKQSSFGEKIYEIVWEDMQMDNKKAKEAVQAIIDLVKSIVPDGLAQSGITAQLPQNAEGLYCDKKFVFKIAEADLPKGNFKLTGKAFANYAKECCEHARKHEEDFVPKVSPKEL